MKRNLARALLVATVAFSSSVLRAGDITGIKLEVTRATASGQLHWKITNSGSLEVYVYDVFLFGPAYKEDVGKDGIILETAPLQVEGGCPNRMPPVLLLLIPAHSDREGDLKDPRLVGLRNQRVSLRIAVGPEPYEVVETVRSVREKGDCVESPYNPIVRWATYFKSAPVLITNSKVHN